MHTDRSMTKTQFHIYNPLSYRLPMTVLEILVFEDNLSFPVCPRCKATLEREFQAYCDRCGQALNWKGFSKAKIRFIP